MRPLHHTQPPPAAQGHTDPLYASVRHLLMKACSNTCSTAAQAFAQLVQPTARFQLALDALLPILVSPRSELPQRILVAYITVLLIRDTPIAINPFKSVLFDTFTKERNAAVQLSGEGKTSDDEQLVWVLWKVLKGDGDHLGPYPPNTLARTSNLVLDEEKVPFDSSQEGAPQHPTPAHRQDRSKLDRLVFGNDVSPEEVEKTQLLSQGLTLLLAARERVLTLSEQRLLGPVIPQLTSPSVLISLDLPLIIAHNPTIATPLLVSLLTLPPSDISSVYLDVLAQLPPTLPTFDILGRLLHDITPATDSITGGKVTVADIVRMEVLGPFLHQCILWLDHAEREERDGLISDDRFAKGVQNLCRFYSALLKVNVVDPASDADSAEIAHFALRNSRFEEANALYRVLASARF
ncbi:hypothetical protein B0F90DRAFT_1854817 [Multifurca ochricompacta]|uniref:CCR4-NOT transcription complex subunit 11 n=1 Tax=Multifurca ochricompacta TaxID=376703 RepID=A0AAD4QEP7_9AGAM|nr:hypothetical protein B0F90DRAFT_1854817 [Multifurca ochricompacta]